MNNKGNALNYLGRYEEAIEYLDKALAINPNHDNASRNKGNLRRYDEAIQCYDKAIEIDPK